MPELTQEEKIKIFEKLPKELQNLMQSEDTGAFLLYLGKKYNLTNDKIHQLSKLLGDVVLRITPITSLAQEINLKITTDSQTAMSLAQELYSDLLSPAMSKTPTSPQANVGAPIPQMPSAPIIKSAPQQVAPPAAPTTDRYREPPVVSLVEPANGTPGIVDLRKIPTPTPPPPPRPLTFTKPIEPIKPKPLTPLIEAEPHRTIPQPAPPSPSQISPRETLEGKPQYIIRPPGLAPTDIPHNILDLKKDKGEF